RSPRCNIDNILHRVPIACRSYKLKLRASVAAPACHSGMFGVAPLRIGLVFGVMLSLGSRRANAQSSGAPAHSDLFQIGAQAISVVTRESPAIHGRNLT